MIIAACTLSTLVSASKGLQGIAVLLGGRVSKQASECKDTPNNNGWMDNGWLDKQVSKQMHEQTLT